MVDRPPPSRADRDEADAALGQLVMAARNEGLRADAQVLHGEAAPSIVSLVNREAADLIVMSTHGRSGLGRWVYGSVAERVLRTAMAPVLLVPPLLRGDWETAASFRIVVPLDGSALAETVLPPVRNIARATQGELLLLRVLPADNRDVGRDVAGAGADPQASDGELALAYLQRIAARTGVPTSVHVAKGPAHDGILDTVSAQEAHLIAMATHGRSGLSRLVMGSVSEAVLHGARTPMLLMRSIPAFVRAYEAEHRSPAVGWGPSVAFGAG
jgi:nucleotide-binding universal stress UspA family protein